MSFNLLVAMGFKGISPMIALTFNLDAATVFMVLTFIQVHMLKK